MVWGDFREGRNATIGGSLLRHQKRLAGLIAGKGGMYHADPLLAQHGMLKVEDLYRQQLRVHAWRFWNGWLPENQAAMLGRIEGSMGMGPGQQGRGCMCPAGTTGRWGIGSRRSGAG